MRLSLGGVVEWTRLIGTTRDDTALAAGVGPNGRVFDGGDVGDALPGQSHAGDRDLILARFESNGRLAWIHQWGTDADDRGIEIVAAAYLDEEVVVRHGQRL